MLSAVCRACCPPQVLHRVHVRCCVPSSLGCLVLFQALVCVFDKRGPHPVHGATLLSRRTPFPSMPVCFWGDEDGSKYRSAYFEAFEGEDVWAHGDFVKVRSVQASGCRWWCCLVGAVR